MGSHCFNGVQWDPLSIPLDPIEYVPNSTPIQLNPINPIQIFNGIPLNPIDFFQWEYFPGLLLGCVHGLV